MFETNLVVGNATICQTSFLVVQNGEEIVTTKTISLHLFQL
jgi:hypothetical protein